jgi:hypothetical protein
MRSDSSLCYINLLFLDSVIIELVSYAYFLIILVKVTASGCQVSDTSYT